MSNRPLGMCEITTTITLKKDGVPFAIFEDAKVEVFSEGGGAFKVKKITVPAMEWNPREKPRHVEFSEKDPWLHNRMMWSQLFCAVDRDDIEEKLNEGLVS